MENIPESAKHVTCDFFLDAVLACVVRDLAAVDCVDEVRLVRLDSNDAPVGTVGRLVVFYTPHGERWQFRPYRFQSWRRMPSLDTPSNWAWRCIETGELTTTAIGCLPGHAPAALPRVNNEDDQPF